MAELWEDDGAWGMAARVPSHDWFPVNTATGAWDLPGQPATLASSAGMPDVTAPPVWGGTPDEAPLAIGQVAGTLAPPMTIPASMQRVARADQAGLLTPQPSTWENIARAVGMSTPTGRAILQGFDQQQQQGLTNRLALRRQQMLEEQNERAEIRDDFNSLMKLSEIKSKSLRKLYTDRFVADMQARGKTLPPDFVEAFKNSGQEEAKAMLQFYQPLLQDLGLDPTAFAELVDQGGIKEVGEALTLAQKLKKDRTEQARLAALDKISAGETLGDVSGVQAPGQPPAGPPTTPTTPTATPTTAAVPSSGQKVIDDALTENARLYNVRLPLLQSIARHESNYNAAAVSPKGATGVMQLMPGTAKDQGVDNPKDPQQNIRGGTRYYAQLLTKYGGNEALALAAYNWGPGNVDKVRGDLTQMPAETQAYVKNVLASAAPGVQHGPADTRQQVAGPGAPAPPPVPTAGTTEEQAKLTALNRRIDVLDKQIEGYTRIGGEEGRGRATATERQRDNLAQERDRLRTRMLEPTRAAERLEAAKQTGAAAAEKKLDEPISPEEAKAYRTGPITRRELVEKFRKGELQPLGPEPTETERSDWRDVQDVQTAIADLRKAMANPKVKQIIGSLWSNPEAFLGRLLSGQVPEAATPEQREYLAQLAETAGVLRTSLLGKAQTPSELKNLIPLLPTGEEPSLGAIEAKLNAIERGAKRRQGTLEKSFKLFRLAPQGTTSGEKPGPNVDKMKALLP